MNIEEANVKEIEELIDNGRDGEARSQLKQIIANEPKNGQLHYLFAFCLAKALGNPNRALQHYKLALEYGYDESSVLKERSSLYSRLGDYRAAISDLEKFISLNPLNNEARERLEQISTLISGDKHNDIALYSPVLVSTVPKSGTILLKNILLSILGNRHFVRYLASSEYIRSLPQLMNRVYFGHIWYSDDLAQKFSSIPKIVLIRDPRDNVVSNAHFLNRNTERHWTISQYEEYWSKKNWEEKLSAVIFGMSTPNEYPPNVLSTYLNYAIKWAGPKTFFVRYEDLIGEGTKMINTVRSLLEFIGVNNLDENTLVNKILSGADPARSGTFRSGQIGEWQKVFTPSHVKQMKMVAPGLVSVLGYEQGEDWNVQQQDLRNIKSAGDKLSETTSIMDGNTSSFPKVDITSMMKFTSNARKLEWEEYLQLRGEPSESSQVKDLVDGWALKLFIETNQFEHALSVSEDLLLTKPKNARWNYYYAYSLHNLRKDLLKALQYYNVALENGFDEFWIVFNRGILFRDLDDFENAHKDLQRAIALNPKHDLAQKLLSDVKEDIASNKHSQLRATLSKIQTLVSNSEYSKAGVELEALLKKFQTDAQLNYYYAFCLHLQKIDLNQALQHYNVALANGFDEFWVRYNRGSLYAELGNLDAAKADINQALRIKPEDMGALRVLEQIHYLQQSKTNL